MRTRYIILSVLLIILGFLTILIPEKNNSIKELSPEMLHYALIQKTRFINSDEAAHMIISGDPAFRLIDIRTAGDFQRFHLSGAVNVPVKDILSEKMKKFLKEKYRKNILYGNGTVKADQCWMILRRLGYENVFVLNGGLNGWWETIVNPQKPEGNNINAVAIEKYEFRLAAGRYFLEKNEYDSLKVENKVVEKAIKTPGYEEQPEETDEEGC